MKIVLIQHENWHIKKEFLGVYVWSCFTSSQATARTIFKKSDVIIMIFPDHGSRYMSKVFNDKWMKDQGFMDEKHKPSNKPIEVR